MDTLLQSPFTSPHRPVLLWLIACALLVASMVFVGGYTRLSGSGLSITEWKPIHGVVPPLNETEWEEEFVAYKATPQYELVNKGMSMDEFKTIFWPEFWHRILGRIVGIVFLIPLIYFGVRKKISKQLFWRMFGISALVGVQGVVGWLMVASGLRENPYVSHFKLALHLSIAFTIFALILWQILDVIQSQKSSTSHSGPITSYRLWFVALAFQIILGAFVAGLHAGLVYNTWPTMNGQWIPDDIWASTPFYMNFVENLTFIQFLHRKLAVLLVAGFLLWWYLHRIHVKSNRLSMLCVSITIVMFAQFILGVLTLVNAVPLNLALTHQMTALLLWALSVVLLYKNRNMI